MRVFIAACVVAAIIAVGAAATLDSFVQDQLDGVHGTQRANLNP